MVVKAVKEQRFVQEVHLFLISLQERVIRLDLLAEEVERVSQPASSRNVYLLPILQKSKEGCLLFEFVRGRKDVMAEEEVHDV